MQLYSQCPPPGDAQPHTHTKGTMGKGRYFFPGKKARVKVLEEIKILTASGEPWKASPQANVLRCKLSLPLTIFSVVLKQIFFKSTSMCCFQMPKIKNKQIPPHCLFKTSETSTLSPQDIHQVADCWRDKLFCKFPLVPSARILN